MNEFDQLVKDFTDTLPALYNAHGTGIEIESKEFDVLVDLIGLHNTRMTIVESQHLTPNDIIVIDTLSGVVDFDSTTQYNTHKGNTK